MKITAQQFVSNSHDQSTFVSVFRHYSTDSQKTSTKDGDIYCLLYISGNKGLPAERVSKFVWDGILDGYIYSSNKSTNDSLKEAITEGVKKLKNLIKNDKSLEELGVNINFVVVVQKKEGLYIGNLGENEIYVFKEGKFVDITQILGKSKASTAGIALKPEDILIAGTNKLLSQNLHKLENLNTTEKVLKVLGVVGEELKGTDGLLYLTYHENKSKNDANELPRVSTVAPMQDVNDEAKRKKTEFRMPKINIQSEKLKTILKKLADFGKMCGKKLSQWKNTLSIKFRSLGKGIAVVISKRFGNKHWYKKVASKVSEVKINVPRYSAKGMRIDGYKVRNKQAQRIKLVFLIMVGIVLLALGINFTIKTKEANTIHTQAVQIFSNAETLVKKAENTSTSDKESTEATIYQAKNALKGLPSNMSEKDITVQQGLEARILTLEDFLYKRVGLTDNDGKITTFLDTRLAFGEGSNPTDIEMYSDNSGNEYLVVTDKGVNAVFRIATYDKKVTKIDDKDGVIKDPRYVSMGNTGIFVYDDRTGVVKATFGNDGVVGSFEALSGLGRSNIQADDIGEFIVLTATDNVYLLARDENSLLKSASYDGRYGLYYKYITDSRFANAKDVLSDISLYFVTSDDPQLIRYSYDYVEQTQTENPLGVNGLDGDILGITKGYTRESLDYGLYLYDSTNKRFLKLEKPQESANIHPGTAVLKKQLIYRGTKTGMWSDVKDFVVDNNESTMYILDGSVVWKVML